MSMAFEHACKALKLRNGDNPTREVIAAKIIDLASGGLRSPTILRDRVLHDARMLDYISRDDGREAQPCQNIGFSRLRTMIILPVRLRQSSVRMTAKPSRKRANFSTKTF
jgi:hypothetical protein